MKDYKEVLKQSLSESSVLGRRYKKDVEVRLVEEAEECIDNEIDKIPNDEDDPSDTLEQIEAELTEAYHLFREEAEDLVDEPKGEEDDDEDKEDEPLEEDAEGYGSPDQYKSEYEHHNRELMARTSNDRRHYDERERMRSQNEDRKERFDRESRNNR